VYHCALLKYTLFIFFKIVPVNNFPFFRKINLIKALQQQHPQHLALEEAQSARVNSIVLYKIFINESVKSKTNFCFW